MEKNEFRAIQPRTMDCVFLAGVVCLFFVQVLFMFSAKHANMIMEAYLPPFAVGMFVYTLVRVGLPKTWIAWLALGFVLWYSLTCVANGDFYLQESKPYVYSLVLSCGVLFPAAFLGDAKTRAKLLQAVALAYAVPIGVLAWIASVSVITRIPWVNPFDTINILGVNSMYSDPYRLNFLGIHPNISAAYLYTALALLIYVFFSSRHTWMKVLYAALGVGIYLAVILTASNAAVGIMALMAAVTVYAVVTATKTLK